MWKYNETVPDSILYGKEGEQVAEVAEVGSDSLNLHSAADEENNKDEKKEEEEEREEENLVNDEMDGDSDEDSDGGSGDVDNQASTKFTEFGVYLQSRVGENKTEKQAKQHVYQVTSVLRDNGGSITNIADPVKAEEWLDNAVDTKKKSLGTLISYCHSVSKFFAFLQDTQQEYSSNLNLNEKPRMLWKKLAASCRNQAIIETLEAEDRNFREALTLEQMQQITNGLEDELLKGPTSTEHNPSTKTTKTNAKTKKKNTVPSNTPVKWDESHQTALEKLIDTLSSPQIMAYPDFSEPFCLYTDASQDGLGAVLTQVIDGKNKVIGYGSSTLTPAIVLITTIRASRGFFFLLF